MLPTFAGKKLKEITSAMIERWLISLQKKGLANSSVTYCLKIMSIMMGEAVRRDLLKANPAAKVQSLKKDARVRGIPDNDEVSRLFDIRQMENIWDRREFYVMNLLAACTGMRLGEILGVRGESLKDGYVLVDKQYNQRYGLCDTKTRDARMIPLPEFLESELARLKAERGDGYLFTRDSGDTPMSANTVRTQLKKAMERIGISREEHTERNITFHSSWRHYFNTVLRSNNISDGKVQTLTGHRSLAMTEHYTHFRPEDFADVKEVQKTIITFTKTG